MTSKRRLEALVALAAAGAAVSAYLSFIALFSENAVACGPVGNCRAVQGSVYAEVAGIPVAVLGLGLYLALLAVTVWRRWYAESALLRAWTFSIALSGVLYSAYLTYLELFVINAVCAWCVTSALIVGAAFVLSMPDARGQARHPAA
jgi:uncharacterized membrane protein